MAALDRSLVEICGFERTPVRTPKQVSVNPGVDPLPGGLKFPDSAGAFHYEESGTLLSITSNRFIHWSTCGDALQLVEMSLDTNLLNNSIRLRFHHCAVLPGGVFIQETLNNVVVLVCTNQSIHRLLLPHPSCMYRSELVTEPHMQSIFTDFGQLNVEDPSQSFVLPGPTSPSGACTAWISTLGHAHFALSSAAGGVTVVTLPPPDSGGDVSVLDLRRTSVMMKITGWVSSAMRSDQIPADSVLSLSVGVLQEDSFIFVLCHDHKLRVWSLQGQTCLLEADMLDFMPACKGVHRLSGLKHRLRLSCSPTTGISVCVYLSVPQRGQFTVLQLITDHHRYSLEHISTLFSTQETLVDFCLTSSDVWALWLDDTNQAVVKYISFEHNTAGQWNQVFVQPPPEEEVHVGLDLDPRETYLELLFSPLRFTASAIVKALQIYRRGSEKVSDYSWDSLKKEVTLAVEAELQSSVTESELSQKEHRQLQEELWCRFYSLCLQYQEVQAAALGLSVSANTGMVCVLRKGFVSFLLPCFAVDHLYLSNEQYLSTEEDTPITEDPDLGRDVLQLFQCLRLVSDAVSMDMAYEMEKAVEHLQPPERAAELVLEALLCNDNDNVLVDIQNKLQDIRNPTAAMMVLLREMDLETDSDWCRDIPLAPGQSLSVRLSLSQLYGSNLALSVVCQAVSHMTMTRAQLCRDLLLLQKIYLRLGDNVFLGGGLHLLQLQQDLVPRCSHLLSSYQLLRQLANTLASSVPIDALEANMQHLNTLELSDCPTTPSSDLGAQTLLELFYRTSARRTIVSHLFDQQQNNSLLWSHMMSNMVTLLTQLLWPSNPGFQFPECLMAHCQYTQLQAYVRLIGPWCQVNIGSCRFVLGQCYLANGEGQKALQCFQEAATEVEKEEFLMKLIAGEDEEATPTHRLQYYNKVLRLLEGVALPELVIQLATLGISETDGDVNSQAALWTRIFKHHLDLGHNSEAYEALTQNPDSSMRLDCLRQLVVVLCERSQLQDLVRFPYVDLHEEVVTIIESRARSLDLLTHNYYELLYAFHIARHNYRKAGTVMFELGMRLGQEVRTRHGLHKQVNCFLSALNCLQLIDPQYSWILRPSSGSTYERQGASPKRNSDGEFAEPGRRQVDVLELKDLQKEYILSRCRLTLAQHHAPSAALAGGASAEELVSLLVQAGLFDSALSLCQTFKLSLTPVFEGLTFKCIKLQFGGEEAQNEAWSWLAANQLTVVNTKESSAADEAWRLLSSYLERFPATNGQYHRYVINKLLTHAVPPPDWLLAAYKRVDAPALLRLLLNFDLLDAAAELVLEYVDAVQGRGHQYFGIERPLSSLASPAWLPYTSIDQLLLALRETHSALYDRVRLKLSEYHTAVEQMSNNRLRAVRAAQ
ncbi:nuclear pore complex protein Nup160 [Gouania willdenowi]|uniref:Uncharacterized protein n=1 Tax=Gouania willdenowi TaxID=441366 RepID=A0A8C5E8J9_GOUWI|nr:nuclear pore complex protein Nup160 [Gouania willdenowi]